MLKRPITFNNYEGEEVTQDWYFNLTQAEILEINTSIKGGLVNRLQYAIKEEDSYTVMNLLRLVVLKSVGEKTADGAHFVKFKIIDGVKVAIADLFECTPAYSALFLELISGDDAADKFIRGVIPPDVAKDLPADAKEALPDDLKAILPSNK